MFFEDLTIQRMSTWEIIERALAEKRPPRGPQWLADELGIKIQVVMNWKSRRVPPKWHREIAQALGLTVDQLEGFAPLPWEKGSGWPFPAGFNYFLVYLNY